MCVPFVVCERRALEAARAPAPGAHRPLGPVSALSTHRFTKYKAVYLFDAASDFHNYKCA